MPVFPSQHWLDEAVRLFHDDNESQHAMRDWSGDFGIVIEAEEGMLDEPVVAHIEPQNGRIIRHSLLEDPDDLDEIEPAYLARGPFSIWKGLLQGTVDPVEAILKRRIVVQGDLQPLIERLRFKPIADRVLSKLETRFPDE